MEMGAPARGSSRPLSPPWRRIALVEIQSLGKIEQKNIPGVSQQGGKAGSGRPRWCRRRKRRESRGACFARWCRGRALPLAGKAWAFPDWCLTQVPRSWRRPAVPRSRGHGTDAFAVQRGRRRRRLSRGASLSQIGASWRKPFGRAAPSRARNHLSAVESSTVVSGFGFGFHMNYASCTCRRALDARASCTLSLTKVGNNSRGNEYGIFRGWCLPCLLFWFSSSFPYFSGFWTDNVASYLQFSHSRGSGKCER